MLETLHIYHYPIYLRLYQPSGKRSILLRNKLQTKIDPVIQIRIIGGDNRQPLGITGLLLLRPIIPLGGGEQKYTEPNQPRYEYNSAMPSQCKGLNRMWRHKSNHTKMTRPHVLGN